jgi:hypothetical protein
MVSSMVLLFRDLWVTLMQMSEACLEVSVTSCFETN